MQDPLFPPEDVVAPTWTVADVARAVGAVLDRALPGEIWVRGEIRGLPPAGDARRNRPHLYFDLIDPAPPGHRPGAVLPVVLWATDRKRVNDELRGAGIRVSAMESGIEVRIRGRVRWWAPGGRLQFQMTGIDPDHTLGRLAADRTAVLAALDAEGLLDRNRGLVLPAGPLRVGLVTSLGSAAHADVQRVLGASGLTHALIEVDARTQGPEAVRTIPGALRAAVAAGAQVVLLVRGGGSRVELAPFDSEPVARAVATCPVPVVTGIGHDIDDSVADRVAHTACPTPTAAAAVIVGHVGAARDRVEALWLAIRRGAGQVLDARAAGLTSLGRHVAAATNASLRTDDAHLTGAARRLWRGPPSTLAQAEARLEGIAAALGRGARRDLADASRVMATSRSRLARAPALALAQHQRRVAGVDARVRAADPAHALARGWSITYRDGGGLVRRPEDVDDGDTLRTVVAGGTITSRVEAGDAAPTPRHGRGSADG